MLHIDTDVVSLDDIAACTPATVGGKAHNLARLRATGFPVPDGVVVTTGAVARLQQGGPAGEPAVVPGAGFADDVRRLLGPAVARLGWPVAVRSSGVAEDLADASYAGLYETVLDVADTDALVDAVQRCCASAEAARVRDYQVAHDAGDGTAGMAVLVQRMVAADAAGVAFTANPVTGDRDEVLIDAVPGLGDRLVSGATDAERWSVRADEAVLQGDGKGALTGAQALAVANLARRVAAHLGPPQDVEWAVADGVVQVLQARPITALPAPPVHPVPVPAVPPPGYWVREASHAPRPWSPLASSLGYEARNAALRDAMTEFGLLIEAIEFAEIGGWEYMRLVPLGGKDRPAPPSWLMPLLFRAVPMLRRRVRRSVQVVRTDVAGGLINRWYEEWRPWLSARTAELRRVDVDLLADAELAAHWDAVVDHLQEGARIHFTVHGATCFPLARLVFTAEELLGWDEATTLRLLAGLSDMSTEPCRRLQPLADAVVADPGKRMVLAEGGPGTLERLQSLDQEFAAAFGAYLEEFGMLALSYDPATPSLAERPELALGLLADQVVRGFDAAALEVDRSDGRTAALAEATERLAQASDHNRERWERALEGATRAYPVREDNEFFTMSGPTALVRHVALAVGRRLQSRGQIDAAHDVFFLRHGELTQAITDGGPLHELVRLREGERAWVEANPGPASYGTDPGGPPSLDALPAEARFANRAVLWYVGRIMEADAVAHDHDHGQVEGIAAAPGRYAGPARLVRGPDEFDRIRAGDVLVCPMTSPVWSVLFASIGALVTDAGGILSHPAIIAREYGIPAVVATTTGTERIRDGQVVTVDGTRGVVTLAG